MGNANVLNYEVFITTIRNVNTVKHEIAERTLDSINECEVQKIETETELLHSQGLLDMAIADEAEKYALWQMALAELEAALASMDSVWIAAATAQEEYARFEYQKAVKHREDMQQRVALAKECVQMANARLEETRSVYTSYRSQLEETIQVQFGRLSKADERIKAYLNVNQNESPKSKETIVNRPKEGLTKREKARIKGETGWSKTIIDSIKNMKQYEVLKKAGLKEVEINGRKCLIKEKIDLDFTDEDGMASNRERMARGLAPLDSETGKPLELHHLGQKVDSPLVELTEEEHRTGEYENGKKNQSLWHDNTIETEVHGEGNSWDQERGAHWKQRAKQA